MPAFTGGCACGAVRYEANAEPAAHIVCHCADCQRAGGGAPAHVLPMRRADVTFTAGEDRFKRHEVTAESGNTVFRAFCGECGTPLFAGSEAGPDFMGVKTGTLDDPGLLAPSATIWTNSAQPWEHIDAGIPQFEKGLPG